jgi:LAS superfamily LD-carboxypeptidase LdcB
MALNTVNAIQNYTGIFLTAVKVHPKFVAQAAWLYATAPNQTVSDVSEKSAFMKTRISSDAHEVQKDIQDIITNPTKYEKFKDHAVKAAYVLARMTQNQMEVLTWVAAYNEASSQKMSETDAVKYADSVTRTTQSSMTAEDLSKFEMQTGFIKLFTQFYSYFNNWAKVFQENFKAG